MTVVTSLADHGDSIVTRTECLGREKSPQMIVSWSGLQLCVCVFHSFHFHYSLKLEHWINIVCMGYFCWIVKPTHLRKWCEYRPSIYFIYSFSTVLLMELGKWKKETFVTYLETRLCWCWRGLFSLTSNCGCSELNYFRFLYAYLWFLFFFRRGVICITCRCAAHQNQ